MTPPLAPAPELADAFDLDLRQQPVDGLHVWPGGGEEEGEHGRVLKGIAGLNKSSSGRPFDAACGVAQDRLVPASTHGLARPSRVVSGGEPGTAVDVGTGPA